MTCTITSLAADQEYVERVGSRLLTPTEAERFREHVRAAHAKFAPAAAPERIHGDIIGDDPVELRPVRRLSYTSKPSVPGHSGADLESGAMLMGCAVAICAAVPIGIIIAKGLASLSIYVGEHLAVALY